MTLTSPVTGPRPAPRLRRRVWSGVLAALLVLGAAPVAAVAAVTGPPEAPPMTFTAAPESDALWNPDQPLQVAVQAANPTDSTVAAGQVSVSLGDSTLADADDVAAWIAEGTDAGELVEAAQTLLPSIAAHGELDVTVDIDASTAEDRAPGVYPLLVTYASAQGELTARSVVVVPITAGPLTTGLATAEQLEALTADDGALRARLDAVTGTAAILAVDPAVPAAIRALGSAAPESATDWAASADRSALQSALSAVTGVPGTSTVDLNELLASTPTRVQLVEIEPDTGRADVLNQFRTDESELTSFATILEDPQLITATERAEILQLIGNGWRETPVAWRDAVTAHRTQTRTTLDAVSIVPPAGITLLGSSAPLQFSIRNDLAWPVSLVLIASPTTRACGCRTPRPSRRARCRTPAPTCPSKPASAAVKPRSTCSCAAPAWSRSATPSPPTSRCAPNGRPSASSSWASS